MDARAFRVARIKVNNKFNANYLDSRHGITLIFRR
jgi:hypothetical protein